MRERFEQGRAVVVGVGNDLPVTITDAQAMAERLCDPERCAYPPEQVRLLCGPDAARSQVLEALDALAAAATPEDTVIIYFSGHGAALPHFHLVPHDYDPQDVAGTGISEEELSRALRAIGAPRLAVFLDCCHAGGQARPKASPPAALPPSVLEEFRQGSGRVLLASSRADEVSYTGDPYSEFTRALLEGLEGRGASRLDGYARVTDVALWVGRMVPERTGDRQHPILEIARADNFALAWYAAGTKALPPRADLRTPGHGKPTPPSRLDPAQQAHWERLLANHRENLLLIEERMTLYVTFTDIPLQLVKDQRRLQQAIAELEGKLGRS